MTAIVEYSQTEAALADLASRYKGVVFEVLTVKGMDAAKKARAELRDYRTSLESKRVEIKAPALERCRLIDAEAKRITAALVTLEEPIDAQIKAQEARRDAEKREKERLEAERIANEERAKKESEETRLAAERAEIAKQRAELEKAKREQEESDRQARLKIEEEQRAARLKIEEEERIARAGREAADRAARQVREAEEAKLRAEQARIEAARLALEEQKRKEREAEEAKQREVLRKQNEILDARQMLATFVTRFGHIAEFKNVVAVIAPLLQKKAA